MNEAVLKAWAATLRVAIPDALLSDVAALLDTMHTSALQLATAPADDEPRD
jgi:hypothetical protein